MTVTVRKMAVGDIEDVKRVDMLSWSDLMARAYGMSTSSPPRTDEGILAYLHADPEGAFVASEEFAGIIGVSFCHTWGSTGWVGPVAVLPMYQGRGVGKELLKASMRYLEERRCVDIGLETMPENPINLGMYLKAGLQPEGLVLILGKRLSASDAPDESAGEVSVEPLSESHIREHFMEQILRISNAHRPGLDYTVEAELTEKFSFGETLVASVRGRVGGFCVLHTVPRRADPSRADVRLLVADPTGGQDVIDPLMAASERLALGSKRSELFMPVPVACRRALDIAFSRGYSVVQSFERLMWMGSSGVSEKNNNLCSWSG